MVECLCECTRMDESKYILPLSSNIASRSSSAKAVAAASSAAVIGYTWMEYRGLERNFADKSMTRGRTRVYSHSFIHVYICIALWRYLISHTHIAQLPVQCSQNVPFLILYFILAYTHHHRSHRIAALRLL